MPQLPAASQPAPFSTPDPSRFRIPKPKRSGRESLTDAGLAPSGHSTTPASVTPRPTPRFAPSWQKRPQSQQRASRSQAHASVHTPVPQLAVRKFSVAGAINSGSRSGSSSASAVSRRFLSHAPLLSQHRRRHSLDRDGFRGGRGGGDDIIEDGSSPPQAPSHNTPQQQPLDDEDGILMVVRESPTATRTKQPAAGEPPLVPRRGIFSASARRRRQRSGLEDDIEDVAPSKSRSGSEDEDENQNEIVAESGKTLEETVGHDSREILMPDSGPSNTPNEATIATPAPLGQTSLTRQKTSAARLLSSIQPLKRRRLFVSPGLITSSPSGAGSDQDNGGEAGEGDRETEEYQDYERPAAFVPRFRSKKTRHAWDGDDIVDDESNSSDEGAGCGDEEIRDIVDYGELLEYANSSDDNGPARNREDDEMMDDYNDEKEDEGDDGVDMILDQTPPRIRRARLRQQEQEQQQEEQGLQEQKQRLPTFQRARLFMSSRKPINDAGDDAGGDAGGEGQNDATHNDKDTHSQDLATTPARQRHYYDALLHQPPPDFFSPQKKRRQKRTRRSRHSNGDEDGLGGLTSPSAAAAAATAAAIHAPELYVPGGLAASLRDWLVQVKSGGGQGTTTTTTTTMTFGTGRFVVDETRQAPGMMRLALGRRQTVNGNAKGDEPEGPGDHSANTEATPLARLLLAGEGRQWNTRHNIAHSTAEDAPGSPSGDPKQRKQSSVVSISHPAWEITLGGQPWIVASDWTMHEEK